MEALSVTAFALLGGLYVWIAYNFPILIKGHRVDDISLNDWGPLTDPGFFPKFSLVVAAKNEALVLERLLSRLLELDYPKDRYEVLVVEDGSFDETERIAKNFEAKHQNLIRFYHKHASTGKPAALNYGMNFATGDIVAVLDADGVPDRDLLARAARYFQDPKLVALQGRTLPINEDENLITKVCSYEEKAWFRPYLLGKEKLGLFVPLTGNCGFVRSDFLRKLGGWDENSLTEDIELSARIVEHEGRIRYATDVVSLQEYPSSAVQFVRQRARWIRGYSETFLQHGRALANVNRRTIDVEFTLARPFALTLVLLAFAIAASSMVWPEAIFERSVLVLADTAAILVASTLLLRGIMISARTKPKKLRNLAWIPIVYAYWMLQGVITSLVLLQLVLGRRSRWIKTEKSGRTTLHDVGAFN
jgi:cellulose synthase/poly-beta-1,6-N-acetylglucosamine synthase-like glycosyltransferase